MLYKELVKVYLVEFGGFPSNIPKDVKKEIKEEFSSSFQNTEKGGDNKK